MITVDLEADERLVEQKPKKYIPLVRLTASRKSPETVKRFIVYEIK